MPERLSRREREKQQHRKDILIAAEALFAARGFHETTMEAVAERAQFAVGTLYTFFPGKQELYEALIAFRCSEVFDEIQTAVAAWGDDPVEVLRDYLDKRLTITMKHREFFSLFIREHPSCHAVGDGPWQKHIEPIHTFIHVRLLEVIEKGQHQGVFRADLNSEQLAMAIEGLPELFLRHWFMQGAQGDAAAYREVIAELFFHGVMSK